MSITRLERDVYTIRSAARLLNMPAPTLKYWLEGETRNGKVYPPVIRERATGSRNVTWGEFVEAGLLRQYRLRQVRMNELRSFIAALRDELGVPYPLAHALPYTSGRDLLWRAQVSAGFGEELPFVTQTQGGQYLLLSAADAFLESVEFDPDHAARWRPLPDAPDVVADPEQRFGDPTVAGIRTLTVWESVQDVGVDETTELFGLDEKLVRQALAYEELAIAQAS